MADTLSHPAPLERQLCFALYGASMEMGRVYKPMLDALGLTYPQYLVLQVLWEEDGRTIGAVAARLALEPSTITPLVKRLEAGGVVTRTRDAQDERQVRVHLTERGRALREESAPMARRVFASTGLTLEAVIALTDEVRALRLTLAEAGAGAGVAAA